MFSRWDSSVIHVTKRYRESGERKKISRRIQSVEKKLINDVLSIVPMAPEIRGSPSVSFKPDP